MTSKVLILTFLVSILIVVGTTSSAFAAQLESRINPDNPSSSFEMKYQRTIFIEYPEGGDIADELRGKSWDTKVSAATPHPDVVALMNKLNQKLASDKSGTRISELAVDYSATLTGRGLNTSIDYKVLLTGEISDYVIRARQGQNPALIDLGWRGMTVSGPVVIDGVEINMPFSVIKDKEPTVSSQIVGTESEQLLSQGIINAEGIKNQPLSNWHFLFDPTGINVDASQFGLSEEISGFVVSAFTMGESSLREGRQVEKEMDSQFTADKTYILRSVESADSANLRVIGFAAIDKLEGLEVLGVVPRAPEGYATTSTGEFPVMIIYGFAGAAAAGAGVIFWMSNKKLKAEAGQGQRGIDPSQLRAYATSAAAGGYQTVRGEAQLISDAEYQKTRSVYDEQKPEDTQTAQSPQSARGSLPKGFKQK